HLTFCSVIDNVIEILEAQLNRSCFIPNGRTAPTETFSVRNELLLLLQRTVCTRMEKTSPGRSSSPNLTEQNSAFH
ncbi:MAG TPA: hypothetical protein VN857_12895, partial [Chthoniobacterales bacterium]|nr:hypothetical protein [Chthoniobacterales bacterium]